VRIDLPADVELVTDAWDDEPFPLHGERSSSVTIPVPTARLRSQPHRLKLWWRQNSPSYFLRKSVALPRISQLPQTGETMVFLGTGDAIYAAGGGWEPLSEESSSAAPSDTGSLDPAIADALRAAGGKPGPPAPLAQAESSAAILLGQREEQQQGDDSSTVTVWSINRSLLRMLLVVFVATTVGVVVWKTDLRHTLQKLRLDRAARTWGGPTLLAALLWMMGPSPAGFWLLILCGTLWAVSAWRLRSTETTFVLTSETAP